MRDPLVVQFKKIREAHKKTQSEIESCMKIPLDSYRHIERGRRPLPDFRTGLKQWVKDFVRCVEATDDERKQIHYLLSEQIVLQYSFLIEDQ